MDKCKLAADAALAKRSSGSKSKERESLTFDYLGNASDGASETRVDMDHSKAKGSTKF